jgi:hypothetical protein
VGAVKLDSPDVPDIFSTHYFLDTRYFFQNNDFRGDYIELTQIKIYIIFKSIFRIFLSSKTT